MEPSLSVSYTDRNTPDRAHTTVASVDLERLRHNAALLKRLAGPAEIMAVVKANAYGHGAPRIAKTLIQEGYRYFMVATLSEALHLRHCGISAPILVAMPPLAVNLPVYSREELHVSVSTPEVCQGVLEYASAGAPLSVHVKIDTGLRRLGLTRPEAREFLSRAASLPPVRVDGIWTHLATAGADDTEFAREQIGLARSVADEFSGFTGYFHVGNTSSLIHPERYITPKANTMYRTGGGLLGISAMPERALDVGLRPILTLKSYVLATKPIAAGDTVSYGRRWTAPRDTRIAVVGAGYADGYPGSFASTSPTVAIRGERYPVVGSVCMDMFMVDLGPASSSESVCPGDEVILFGEGAAPITEIAALSGRKAYEISCGISQRVVRTYV